MGDVERSGLLIRFLRDRSANFATLTALTLPVLLAAAALAVDEASLYLERRQLQSAVDLASLAAASDPARAREIAAESLAAAGITAAGTLDVVTGRYTPDAALAPSARFVASETPANAVRVVYAHPGRVYFARQWFAPPQISAQATAFAEPQAAFSLGSRLASLEGGAVNNLLTALLGTSVSLNVLDHRALAALDVDLLRTLDLLATRIGLTAATYEEVLDAEIGLPDLAAALVVAAPSGSPGAAVLAPLAPRLNRTLSIRLRDIIDLGTIAGRPVGQGQREATLAVSALQMLSLAALLADGGRQLALGLGVTVPGLVGASVSLAVGEPMQNTGYLAVGPNSQVLETAQLRLALTVNLRVSIAGLGLLEVALPLVVQLAPSSARLASITCPPGGGAALAVEPGLLSLAIGRPAPLTASSGPLVTGAASLVDVLGLVKITAYAAGLSSQTAPVTVRFSEADIAAGTIRSVSTTTPLESLLVSLLSTADIDVKLLNIPLLGPLLSATGAQTVLRNTLVGLAPALDDLLVGVLSTLGVGIGEADLRLNGILCRSAVLVE